MFKPRLMQAEILKYRSGRMGVAAVPGSGKTATLSALAAQLIREGCVLDDQEILIVTLVNSAVDNFSTRIAGFMREAGLLENMGYRVRTLHGLAHDIVRERPDLVNLSERFTILDETESMRMIEAATSVYLREHPELPIGLVDPSIDLREEPKTHKAWTDLVTTLNVNFISQAKDLQLEAADIQKRIETYHLEDALLDMATQIYMDYQRGLKYRGAVDFSDLIRLAYQALQADKEFLERLRYRWPYILEDEAQDSSQVQENILRLLTGAEGNWVRVGDTNQAIYETFTTASPIFLRNFLREKNVTHKDLANSGRSNRSIMNLANSLNLWTQESHPAEELRSALTMPLIVGAPQGDPQPNPPDHGQAIYIHKPAVSSEREIKMVAESIKKWLPEHQDKTLAVLCPIAFHAEKVVEALQNNGVEVVEMLKSTQSTRRVTRLLEKILVSLADPSSVNKVSTVFHLLLQDDPDLEGHQQDATELLGRLKKLRQLEDLLYPVEPVEWQEILDANNTDTFIAQRFSKFLSDLVRWQNATPLPIDQLLLTIGRDLFNASHDLALTHKLALSLEISARNHPEYQLPQFALELAEIASNERKFSGFSEDDTGFNPEAHKGKALVTTFHKAKGLEWDRVYLLSVNSYDFPSAQEGDEYKGEKWFIAGKLNHEAELLARLKALAEGDIPGMFMEPGPATLKARLEYSAERLRLLYVGITRAREWLIITWNTGRRKDARMALALEAMQAMMEDSDAAA